jgi:hypothetical protein
MKMSKLLSIAVLSVAGAFAGPVTGDYLEVRSCDIYTGPCFANSEMNLTGKEGMLVWSIKDGVWKGTDLAGLNVLAVVKTDGTLGNLKYEPRSGDAVLIVDSKASELQKAALTDFARAMGGDLISKVVAVKSAPIEAKIATCTKLGCASVKAGDLVTINTSCMSAKHDICGNEETFYPPLSKVQSPYPVFTDLATFNSHDLNVTWQIAGKRSAFLGTFSASGEAPRVALR